jgi:hypothetical protein
MSCAAAAFPNVTRFNTRPSGEFRRFAAAGAVLALGTLTAAGAIAVVTVAAAWLMAATLSSHGSVQTKVSIGRSTIALAGPYPTLAGTTEFAGSTQILSGPGYVPPITVANYIPPTSPQGREATLTTTRSSNLTHVAELTPAAPQLPATIPLPPRRAVERPPSIPLPHARPVMQARLEVPLPPAIASAAQAVAAAPPAPAMPAFKLASLPQPRDKNPLSELDNRTALYDIAAHTVFLPNGTRLEAHSGLGDKLDDPRYIGAKARGPTPPNVYNLALREEPFHGVRAIRLKPIDEDKMFGRDGMLAHTYMLGPSGQSFGCVSFKNYDAFLNAYLRGEFDRLVVVAHRDGAPPAVAHDRRRRDDRWAFNN